MDSKTIIDAKVVRSNRLKRSCISFMLTQKLCHQWCLGIFCRDEYDSSRVIITGSLKAGYKRRLRHRLLCSNVRCKHHWTQNRVSFAQSANMVKRFVGIG
jgi:hypothetical protein